MFVHSSEFGWFVHAPAKINLVLDVLGRESDGYHQVETLLVPVRLFDTLAYSNSPSPLSFRLTGSRSCPVEQLAAEGSENLAVRAIERLAQHAGRPATGRLLLYKRIPVQAGLGGGSSDAAAALVVANHAWRLGYSRERLASIASELGADVPFFLQRGPAMGTGRGDSTMPVAMPAGLPVVLVQPPVGLATAGVFAELGLARGERVERPLHRCCELVAAVTSGAPLAHWKHLIHNSLQPAAERLSHWIGRIASAMSRLGVVAHQMTGSGSGYYALCRNWRDAQTVAARLRGQSWRFVAATRTCL